MNEKIDNEFWRGHLQGVDGPLIHFVQLDILNPKTIQEACNQIGFGSFIVDCQKLLTPSDLMNHLAMCMKFPDYFRANWDGLLDLITDLSWLSASGYTIVFHNADVLAAGPFEFSNLLSIAELAVSFWRDDRGEYGERTKAVPFHFIFSGTGQLRDNLVQRLREPLCTHVSCTLVQVILAPGGISGLDAFRDTKELLQGGADASLIPSFLKQHGVSRTDSSYIVAALLQKPIPQAKAQIDNDPAWIADRREADARIRIATREALRDLGFEDPGDI